MCQRQLLIRKVLILFRSLLISVKADTAALRRDVQQLLANRTRQRRLSIESTCETVITLAAERLVLADSSTSKTPISAVESDSENAASSKEFNGDSDNDSMIAEPDSSIIPRPLKENPENNPKEILGKNPEKTSGKTPKVATKKTHKEIPEKATKNISCKRVCRVKWYTDAHKTQCVTITPEGDIVAMSSMKEVMAWDLSEFDDDAMRPPLLFDEGLRSWHVPAKLVLERDEMNGLILAVSSSRSVYGGFGGGGKAAVESKLLVHSYETDKTLYSEVLPRRFIGMGLSFPNDVNAIMEVILPSSKRAHMIGLLREGEGDKMTSMESQEKLDTNDVELDEYSSGLSMSGEHLLASAKRPDKYGALVVFMFNTCSGEQVGKTKLPDGFALVTGIPVGSYGREAILVLWADDTKATGLFRWEVNTGRLSGEVVHRFEYARNAWQRYAVSPDGQFVAVCLSKQEVEIVDVRTGEQVALLCPKHVLPRDVGTSKVGLELTKGNCRGNLMAWSVTRRRLVVATRKGAEVWDISGAP